MAIKKRAIAATSTAVKEEVKPAVTAEIKKEEAKPAEKKAEENPAEKKTAAKKATAAKKTTTAKKAPAKKAETKTAEKKTTAAAKKTTAAKKTAVKKTTTKKAAAKTTTAKKAAPAKTSESLVIQFRGREVSIDQIRDRFKDAWTKDLGRKASDVKDVTFYIKPEDSAVYYVVNNGEVTESFAI